MERTVYRACCSSESIEAKLPLLWSQALYLCVRQCEYAADSSVGPLALRKLTLSVTQGAEHRAGAGWGLLGAMGIIKGQPASNKLVTFRFSYSFIGYLLSFKYFLHLFGLNVLKIRIICT